TGRHHPWHPDNKKYAKVNCGGHTAKSCQGCPQGHGKDWCNGDCGKSGKAQRTLQLEKRERAKLSEGAKDGNYLTLSVVLPCGFEHEFFVRTVQSVFYETPKEILKEVVVVDDASDPSLKTMWSEEDAAEFSVKYVRLDEPHGLIGAKQAGANAATGDIIVFFDCHVKPAEDYWVPYVKEVQENYKRVVIPTITNLNVDKWEEFGRPKGSGGGMSKCYLTFDAEFKWTTDNTPYVPIMSGGLLAISRKWFFEIGGYDSSMKGWGGENLDQSLRIWTCGGEIVTAPKSYVAHMWRDGTAKTKAKYKVGAGDAIKNRARAVKAHLGRWYDKTLTFPSFAQWRGKELDTSSITDAFSDLKCENFEWYLNRFKHIYQDAGVIPKEVFQIEAIPRGSSTPMCLELKAMKWTNYGSADQLVLKECTGSTPNEPRPIWWHKSSRLEDGSCCGSLRAWNTDQCIDGRNTKLGEKEIATYTCDLDSGYEAYLQHSNDGGEGEFLLKIGRGSSDHCVGFTEDFSLETVDCRTKHASKWRKRHAFTPIEYDLLSSESKNDWEKES
ncbi:hypothetical protein ACHAXR_003762, partial [Thalassiosira sp. AJA248-18]